MIRSKAWLAVVIPTCILVLSGCLNVSADISLNAKAEATGSYTVDIPKQVAAMMGITSAESLEGTLLESKDLNLPRGNSVDVKETDTSYVMTVKLMNAPLTEDEMKAEVLPDGRIKFTFGNEGSTDTGGMDLGVTMGSISVKVVFPGDLVEVSPEFTKVNSKTITLKVALDKNVKVYAISEPGTDGSSNVKIAIAIFLAIVAASVLAELVRKRAKKSEGDIVELE